MTTLGAPFLPYFGGVPRRAAAPVSVAPVALATLVVVAPVAVGKPVANALGLPAPQLAAVAPQPADVAVALFAAKE